MRDKGWSNAINAAKQTAAAFTTIKKHCYAFDAIGLPGMKIMSRQERQKIWLNDVFFISLPD
jgi:hypothetical protein